MTVTAVWSVRGVLAPGWPATAPDGAVVLVARPDIESVQNCPTCRGFSRLGEHTPTGWCCWVCRVVHPWT